ncbi:hypothetical protein J7E88_02725 [Streptomyces sp. ISL-10]|uniref:hypothetical protein n=1 Tax=Streptomyces sp. ISL-10 TaxID=2819172 RepID=UPI001BEB847D|nr:hypothetical protein [Streptomyces sp. ISL-10]MBT2364272.1 hypothetical protein [Streptomyces sp. ISL-10]
MGKTNVLKVFDFLADMIQRDLEPALALHGGFDEVAYWGGEKPSTSLRIGLKATWTTHSSLKAPDEYELTINRRNAPSHERGYTLSRQEPEGAAAEETRQPGVPRERSAGDHGRGSEGGAPRHADGYQSVLLGLRLGSGGTQGRLTQQCAGDKQR